jgi:Carboxypeptidase regulatory-like domain
VLLSVGEQSTILTFNTNLRTLASIAFLLQRVSNEPRALLWHPGCPCLSWSRLEDFDSVVVHGPFPSGEIRNVQSSSDNSDQSRRPAEIVDYIFVRAKGCGCRICGDGCRKPSRTNLNNGRHHRGVTDTTAAVVSGVSVTLKNVDTGSSTSTTTNSQGSYNFPFLQPGHYSVSATHWVSILDLEQHPNSKFTRELIREYKPGHNYSGPR